MHKKYLLPSLAALGLAFTMTATSVEANEPNWKGTPAYGTVRLESGFTPDPWQKDMQAGGSDGIDSSLSVGCGGYIAADKPDLDLNYSSGNSHLYIHVASKTDTTLVIYTPDGRWICNDDFNGLDPMVVFYAPKSGNYNIWVGVHGSNSLVPAKLMISEVNPL